ncbi:thiamine biosynthesis protein ThiF [Paenibacillus pectinilyticus]|uniref:Thiamine biosynthesis protein ThiF n=1 Tax=Paenibacillus pectinilyticus TaxID=512399 RepID=A0A1C0ZU76_9BACL|nr:ThiF family adenylyltransferase [Paenibacillus pectinilyticus]OCT11654.1 thiamine biosynthesis protein ThiF [Paenibacillus pectinilyticus]
MNSHVHTDSTPEVDARYSRQVLFSPIGLDGQRKLGEGRVAIVGMGALGTVLANHMVRAGVGYVRIIDRDFVDLSNLQRQMLYDEEDAAGTVPKAIAAAARLQLVNSAVVVDPHVCDLNATNAEQLLHDVDLILDGTDNFAVRFLLNDISIKLGIPWIYGGAVASRGVSLTILPGQTPCLRCLFTQAPAAGTTDTCDTAGVIGGIIHVVASFQATEALKLLVGAAEQLNLNMQQWDLWFNQNSSIRVAGAKKSDCPACANQQFDYLDAHLDSDTIQSLCGRNSVQIHPILPSTQPLDYWEERLKPLGLVEKNRFLLKFHASADIQMILFPGGRVLIQGTEDLIQAKSLYSRYIGM